MSCWEVLATAGDEAAEVDDVRHDEAFIIASEACIIASEAFIIASEAFIIASESRDSSICKK